MHCYRALKREENMQGPEDDAGLAGKVALISGGGAAGDGIGNGRAAAILLARSGTKVVVADRDLKLAERTVAMIAAEGGTAAALAADVTIESDCRRLVDLTIDRFGRLDCLDNNVGIGSRGSVVDEKPEQYRRVMQINVESMFLLSKYAIPAMIGTAKGGAIVNISSISALRPRGLTTYTTSKAAIIGLTRAMAVDHGGENIRVNWTDVHADGLCPRHERGSACPARQGLGAEAGRHRLGRQPRRQIPAQRPCPLHHGPGSRGRRRRHPAGAGARIARSLTRNMADAPRGRRDRPTEPLVPHLTFAVKLAGRHFEAGQKLDIALIASSRALADASVLV